MRFGFYGLVALGADDSVMRGAYFMLLPFLLISKGALRQSNGHMRSAFSRRLQSMRSPPRRY